MHQLEQDGSKAARRVNRLVSDRERMIGAILLGSTLINILAVSLTTALLDQHLETLNAVLATTLLMTAVLAGLRSGPAQDARHCPHRCGGAEPGAAPALRGQAAGTHHRRGAVAGMAAAVTVRRAHRRKRQTRRMTKFAAPSHCTTRRAMSNPAIAT